MPKFKIFPLGSGGGVRESRLTWPFVPSQHSQPNTQSFVFTWFYIMTKEELQNYGHNKTTTTPETIKQEDFRQPPAHARFTHVHSRTRQFGECHHTHNNSHSTTVVRVKCPNSRFFPLALEVVHVKCPNSRFFPLALEAVHVKCPNSRFFPSVLEVIHVKCPNSR